MKELIVIKYLKNYKIIFYQNSYSVNKESKYNLSIIQKRWKELIDNKKENKN